MMVIINMIEVYSLELYPLSDPPKPSRPKAGLGLVVMVIMMVMMALMALFRWYVEYQKNNDCVVIGETEPNQSVYLFKCENSTVQVADFPAVFFLLSYLGT